MKCKRPIAGRSDCTLTRSARFALHLFGVGVKLKFLTNRLIANGAQLGLQTVRSCSCRGLAVTCVFASCVIATHADSFEAGLNLYRTGDCLAASKLLKEAVASNPAANLPLGQCYVETRAYDDAVEPLLASLKSFPSDTRALRLLVFAYSRLKKIDEANNVVHSYLVQHPESLDAKVESGRLQLASGDKENAAITFQSILDQSPDFPPALLGLGLVASANQKWQDAVQYLVHATQIAPGVPAIYSALGDAYARQGKCDQAIGPYKQAFDLMPSNFAAAKALAKCYAEAGKEEEVARVLRSATLEEARDTEATEMVVLALKSDPKALGEYLRDVIELNPENVVARKRRAEALETSHNMDEAEAEYLEILKLEKDNPDPVTCYKLGSIKEAKNSLEDAHRYYEIAARAPTATADMHLSLARINLAMKHAPDAQTELSKVGDPANQTPEFRLMQLEVYVQTSQFDSAAALANDYLAQHPNDAKALGLAAQSAGKQQRYEDQVGFLERLVGVSPEDKDARYRLVRLYIAHAELKKDDRTLELLSNFVSRKEVDPEGYLCLANLYGRNKDTASAKAFYDLGFSYMPTPVPAKFAWAYTSYAKFLEGQGNLDDALVSQMRAVEVDPNNENAQYNLGVIYLKRRQFEDAEQVLGKLKAMNSDLAVLLEDDVRKTPHKVKTGAQ